MFVFTFFWEFPQNKFRNSSIEQIFWKLTQTVSFLFPFSQLNFELQCLLTFHGNWSNFQVGLSYLLGEKFFIPCLVHESEKKSEKNTFCLDCCISLCPHCLPPHKNHRLLQVYAIPGIKLFDFVFKLVQFSFWNLRLGAMFIKMWYD